MNIYTTIVIIALIIAICYLANLYASVSNWKEDKVNALKKWTQLMTTCTEYWICLMTLKRKIKIWIIKITNEYVWR